MTQPALLRTQADHAAVEDLARQYRPALIRYFERRGIGGMDAEDAAQEVFARLSRREGLAEIERLKPYLFETATNVAIDHHRRGKARAAGAHDSYDEDSHAPPDFSPERIHAGREELNILLTGLRELPERTRHVFILARLENIKQHEIAQRLGISASAVEKHLVKAVAHLAVLVGRAP